MPKLVYHDSSGARGTVEIGNEVVLIGRATECQIQTQDGLVSRRHARVIYDGSYWIEDLGSANGVYVGNERVQKYKLKPGDTFRCGHVEVRFEVEDMNRTAIGVSPGVVVPMPPLAAPPVVKVPLPSAPPPAAAAPLSFAEAAAQQRAAEKRGSAAASAVVPPAAATPPLAGPPPAAPSSDPPGGRGSSKTGSMAPPPPAAVLLQEAPPLARGPDAEITRLRAELEVERQRRAEVERECDQAQQRASEMLRRADDAQRLLDEAKRRTDELQQRLEASAVRSAPSDGDSERLRRRIEQLESELRRKGGGGGAASAGGDQLRAAEGERDRLRARVSELEAQLAQATAQAAQAGSSPPASADQEMEMIRLKRRVEQLESELRRARGGKPGGDEGSSAKLAELEAEVRRLREEKDAALQAQSTDSRLADELASARRRIEQLESDARRRPMGAVSDDKRVEAQRVELESALRQLRETERERDSLREVVAKAASPAARTPKEVSDSLTQVSDGLADVRAALRASGDDIALEQLEQLRAALRKACGLLGIPV